MIIENIAFEFLKNWKIGKLVYSKFLIGAEGTLPFMTAGVARGKKKNLHHSLPRRIIIWNKLISAGGWKWIYFLPQRRRGLGGFTEIFFNHQDHKGFREGGKGF